MGIRKGDKGIGIALLFILLVSGFASASTITGKVRAQGRQEAQEDINSGKYESHKYRFYERVNYSDWRDFVVYIDGPVPGSAPPLEPVQVVIQKDATFVPHVLPVMVGTVVEWPNHDDIYHNVFSMSEAKPFDLGLYKSDVTKKVTFDKVGRVDVFCSIHTKMNAIVLVLQNPYFGVTDKNGNYTISNVPPGVYQLKAWHERMPPQMQQITVPASGNVAMDFVLTVSGLPKY
jgi:plastocyanin